MGNLFAHKSFLVSVNRAEEDQMLYGMEADFFVKQGELILTDQNGNVMPITEQRFKDNYVPVEKVKEKKIKPSKSPFESAYLDEMAKGYAEMANLNQEEDENYIKGTEELIKNKAF